MMALQPSTPLAGLGTAHFGGSQHSDLSRHGSERVLTPAASNGSLNPGSMPRSLSRRRNTGGEGSSPKVSRTTGARPSCLVNASVTYCGNNQIYAFGGFDQYTDEGELSLA